MNVSRIIGTTAVALLLSVAGLRAARSDVADAVMRADKAAVRALLEQRADVNMPQADGATALHWAVYRDDLETAELLIRAGANAKVRNVAGATPLSMACISGNVAMIDKLLAAGADPNERLSNGETALMMAARTGNVDAMKALLDRGADVNAKENLRGTTALMWAAAQEHPAAVKLLVDRGADMSARSKPAALGRGPYLAPSRRLRAEQGKGNADRQPAAPAAAAKQPATPAPVVPDDDQDDQDLSILNRSQGGGLTPLVFAARQGDLESARILVAAGADVNQVTEYGWSPLLTAVHNRYYKLATHLLDHGADPSLPNKGGWTPLYIATDNRNIEGGDYPTRKPDMDHLDLIKKLLDKGANPNARAKDSTETRTTFTMQWLNEDGATPFLRAAQSGDITLMRLLLAHGADPMIHTANQETALMVAAGISWVEGLTYEHSAAETLQAVKLCLELGIDPNAANSDGRTALHGAAHKGRSPVVQVLVDHGAKLDARDDGSRDTIAGGLLGRTWLALDYAEGLVRVGVQSAIPHPETAALIRQLMLEAGIPVPQPNRTPTSICITPVCQ